MSTITQQQRKLEQALEQALILAKPLGDAAEANISESVGLSVTVRLGQLEKVEFHNDSILSVSIYSQQRCGSASTNDLSPEAIKKTVLAAGQIAQETDSDPCSGLADLEMMAFNTIDLDLYHPYAIDPTSAGQCAIQAEKAALEHDRRIVNSEGATMDSDTNITVYGNSHGILKSYPCSKYVISCCVLAEQDGCMQRDYSYTVARDHHELRSPQWVGTQAAQRALARLGARQLQTAEIPILFTPEVAASLFAQLATAINGKNLYRKNSFLINTVNCSILPDWLSINEYPHLPKQLASAPFDNEGVRNQDRTIIQNGVLQTYLLDSYTARKLNMQTTGHAGKLYNWRISAPTEDFTTLLKKMYRGLVVVELLGQGVNLVTGDYSHGAVGFWVEQGEIQYPVHEITIASNLKTMFKNIVAIGNDIDTRSCIHTGSILLSAMQVAGS